MKVRRLLRYYGALKNAPGRPRRARDRLLAEAARPRRPGATTGSTRCRRAWRRRCSSSPPSSRSRGIVILDEPFSGLDPVNADVLREAVLELRRRGETIVFSTHDMAVAEKMCDRIFMIFRGRKVLDGTLDEIQSTYGHDTVRVRTGDGRRALADLDEVEAVSDYGNLQEVRLKGGSDAAHAQRFLARLVARTPVYHFEVTRPSLHDVFVRIARPDADPGDVSPVGR